jgi:2-polyprenyl-6-hydroxyphenyl methylase/3-demethylubiquinone-9 3-methyltransferase
MDAAMTAAGLRRVDLRGLRYLPVLHRADWVRDTSVNYIAAFVRDPAHTGDERASGQGRAAQA